MTTPTMQDNMRDGAEPTATRSKSYIDVAATAAPVPAATRRATVIQQFSEFLELSRFDVDGDGKFDPSELRSIDVRPSAAPVEGDHLVAQVRPPPRRLPTPLRPWLPL